MRRGSICGSKRQISVLRPGGLLIMVPVSTPRSKC
jgi:hypothetical protein